MITRALLRLRMLDALGDERPSFWRGRPTNSEYTKDPTFRFRVAGPCREVFGAKCWACGQTARELELRNSRLTTAHLLYPAEPFGEVVDTDLTRSDVVLLCWDDHMLLDSITDSYPCDTIDEIRDVSIRRLRQIRRGHQTGEEDYDDDAS